MTQCVLQGEKGIGLSGPPGRVGPPGLKVSMQGLCPFESVSAVHQVRI